uniref:uncharacterized protein LOC113197671 n=1 Tax=Urocitellus parryii TaxID=9999 RepID=UPI000E55D9D9|nr:uncharacterized protein LOC113197671 [Urocitellus parryii]
MKTCQSSQVLEDEQCKLTPSASASQPLTNFISKVRSHLRVLCGFDFWRTPSSPLQVWERKTDHAHCTQEGPLCAQEFRRAFTEPRNPLQGRCHADPLADGHRSFQFYRHLSEPLESPGEGPRNPHGTCTRTLSSCRCQVLSRPCSVADVEVGADITPSYQHRAAGSLAEPGNLQKRPGRHGDRGGQDKNSRCAPKVGSQRRLLSSANSATTRK